MVPAGSSRSEVADAKGNLKIIEFGKNLGIGGIERAMQEFAIGLHNMGHKVIVCVLDDSGPRKVILENYGIKVIKLQGNSNDIISGDNQISARHHDLKQLTKIVKKFKADIVHSHAWRIKEYCGDAYFVQEVVFANSYSPEADANIIISNALALKLSGIYNLGEKDIVIGYPQNVANWDKIRGKMLGVPKDSFVIGRLGRAEPSKTDFLLLQSAPRIARKIKNVHFIFVGLPLLYRKILGLYPVLNGKITFLEESSEDEDLAKFYETIDVLWHTASWGETFGNVIAEAMTFGKPVVTHSTPFKGGKLAERMDNSQIELVDHLVTGLVANYPNDVVEAMYILASDPQLVREFGQAGRQKVEEKYSSEVVIRQFLSFLENKTWQRPDFRDDYNYRLGNSVNHSSKSHKRIYLMKKKMYLWFLESPYLIIRYILRERFKYNIEVQS